MTKGIWRKQTINGLAVAVPVGADSIEALRSYKEGREFISDTRGARNPKQLNMWWALCSIVAEHFSVTKESISDDVKKALGHTITIKHWDGEIEIRAASINEESMDQVAFNSLFKLAIEKMSEWMGSAPRDLRARFDDVIAEKRYEGMRRG